jgi:hypothetical protein
MALAEGLDYGLSERAASEEGNREPPPPHPSAAIALQISTMPAAIAGRSCLPPPPAYFPMHSMAALVAEGREREPWHPEEAPPASIDRERGLALIDVGALSDGAPAGREYGTGYRGRGGGGGRWKSA